MQSDLLFPLLGAVFGNLGGEVQFSCEGNNLTSRDADAIEAFIADCEHSNFGEIYASVVTSTGEVAGRVFTFPTEDHAHDFVEEMGLGTATIAFTFDGDVAALFYLNDDVPFEPTNNESDHIPVPAGRWSIYEGSLPFVLGRAAEPAGEPETESVEVDATNAEPASFKPYTLNDATFVGEVSLVALDTKLELAFGKNAQEKIWRSSDATWASLIHTMSKHQVGQKDGSAFIQGTAIGGERKVPAIDKLYVMGLDVDSGIFPQVVIEKLKKLGLTSIVYTTHSNMKTDTFLLENSYNQFCKKKKLNEEVVVARIRQYLLEERSWEQRLVDTVELGEVEQTAKGKGFWLSHDPMPKFRVVFPLNEPFIIAEQRMSQLDAQKLWKSKIIGLAKTLELPIDESCLDLARLFYLPRHPKGMPFGVWVTGGDALDFQAIPEGKVRGQVQTAVSNDVFARAGEDLAAKGDNALVIDGNFSLKRWAREIAHDFDIATLFRVAAPAQIRNDQNTSKVTVECPFDYTHSNAGDTDDQGCFVQSAAPEVGINTFVVSCSHNSCKGRDRLEFIAEAVNLGWFTRDDLSSPDYRLMTADNQKDFYDIPKLVDEALEYMGNISASDTRAVHNGIIAQVEILTNSGATGGDLNMFMEALKRTKIISSSFAKEAFNMAKRKASQKMTPEQKQENQAKRTHSLKLNGCTPFILNSDNGYLEQRKAVCEKLTSMNKGETRIFNYGGIKFSVEQQLEHDDVAVSALGIEHMADKLSKDGGIAFLRQQDDSLTSVPIPERILKEMQVNEDWYCPKLQAFSELPYFNKQGKLVKTPGYDQVSMTYLKPSSIAKELKVPEHPSLDQVLAARDLLLVDTFGDFPFDDGPEEEHQAANGVGSRAHFLALLLQPFIREMIQGPTPIYLVSKPTAGTGASLLLSCSLFITSGKPSKTATHKYAEEEQRKEITSVFVAAKTYFLIDNIRHEINSAAYCNLATSTVWEDRLLGASKMASYPNRIQFIIAGNNPRGTYEIMRRCLPIRLDAKIDPRKRDESQFKHPRLEEFVHQNHERLVEAILTIIMGWIKNGRNSFTGKPLMSFESWSEITGGILEFAEVPGFLTNLHLSQKYANDETSAFETFYGIIADQCNGLAKPFTMRQLAEIFSGGDIEFPQIGARYNDQANQLAVNLDRALKEKIGAPYDIVTRDGRHITVKLSRLVAKDPQKGTMFQLVPM